MRMAMKAGVIATLVVVNGALASQLRAAEEIPMQKCTWTCALSTGRPVQICGTWLGGCGGDDCSGNPETICN